VTVTVAEGGDVRYRSATRADADAVANIHADSWRRHYRGAYADAYLDGDVLADRLQVWQGRLADVRDDELTIVAEHAGSLLGFVHTILGADPTWGALVDNLHVTTGFQRRGIGTALLEEAAAGVLDRTAASSLYLWVLSQNEDARAFYESKGGTCVERGWVEAPAANPSRIDGAPVKLRYVWPDPRVLISGRSRLVSNGVHPVDREE
jgi:ribosomal protein S18 acetylase RimI-like enzyme